MTYEREGQVVFALNNEMMIWQGANPFKPVQPSRRRAGTGCISQINDHLYEGRYSPMWINGKKPSRYVYAHTREECEEKLKVLIAEMKAELAELKDQRAKGK